MSEKLKKCRVCGRIITDGNNKTGLCPKHQKGMNTGVAMASIVGIGIAIKKFGPKAMKIVFKVMEK